MVVVKGGAHLVTGTYGRGVADGRPLGLASDSIRISPRYVHHDMRVDDFGPEIPADVMQNLADVTIRMNLVHVDKDILDVCLRESLGGGAGKWGVLAPAGEILGGNKDFFASGWHYTSLNLLTNDNLPWRFRAAYLSQNPAEIPLGTRHSIFNLTWRAIPYYFQSVFAPVLGGGGGNGDFGGGEVVSSGVVLFDHSPDSYVVTV